jgi:sugar lactone lactonase YvrE
MKHGRSYLEPECVADTRCELGEGPIWRDGALWFVDIRGPSIHRYDPATGEVRNWAAPAEPGFIVPTADGGWIAGLRTGLSRFDPATGDFSPLLDVEPALPGNRLNDGYVDSAGRLWFGSMDNWEESPTGALYRLDQRGAVAVDRDYIITNGPAVSPDSGTLYHTDTLARTIHAFDLDADGSLSNRRTFATIEDGAGYPDGLAVDAEGGVWTGLFGGHAARRYSVDGHLTAAVAFPCANVTSLTFGGSDLCTVYATTARKGLGLEQLAAEPLAGGLFAFRADTPGLPQHLAKV